MIFTLTSAVQPSVAQMIDSRLNCPGWPGGSVIYHRLVGTGFASQCQQCFKDLLTSNKN